MGPKAMRAEARARRHARIERTALELFRDRGFDRVSVADICAAADVGPATFYRHFGTKEAVVFAYRDDFTAALRAAIAAAAGLPESAQLPSILEQFAQFLEAQQPALALRDQIVVGHPRLMQQTVAVQRDMESVLATGLAGLRGSAADDAAATLEAGLGILVLRIAVRTWRAGGVSLLRATQETFGDVRRILGTAGNDQGAKDRGPASELHRT